jgi:UDP-N-acetylglucosamine 4-epimerase
MYHNAYHTKDLSQFKFLITGGAGFIGSNLVAYLLKHNAKKVRVLDDFSNGYRENLTEFESNPAFELLEGDIRDLETCKQAMEGIDYVSHQAALGSVPRSINDPATTNAVNISGFLNMMIALKDSPSVKRMVYAASSSTYGDSPSLPKVEETIGKPLSPYAVTKYVNELYADVFAKTYGMQCIGLRYFNVFGKRQTPDGAYAAVIPLWVKELINHQSPKINGDGSYSRDFTYIENVIQANEKALFTTDEQIAQGQREYYNLGLEEHKYYNQKPTTNSQPLTANSFSEVFNVAFGGNTNLIQLFEALRDNLSRFDNKIQSLKPEFGPFRAGDIPHSQASIKKAEMILGYKPEFDAREGFARVAEWYFDSLKVE